MSTISFFILVFYIAFFLVNIKLYLIIFIFISIFGGLTWIIIYILETFFGGWWFPILTILRHLSAILCFSVLSPGLILSLMHYIKNNSNKKESRKIFHNYRIHEGFVGIIFIIIAFVLLILRYNLVKYEIFRTSLRIYLAIDMILLYLFLFFGSFLVLRDRRDIITLKLIEKREIPSNNYNSGIFNPVTSDSLKFFKSPKVLLYPMGILLNSIAANLFIHGTDFLPEEIFSLNHETLVMIGIILNFIAGGMLGLDWYRLFGRIYPELYQEFEHILDNLRKN
ncbi:MAG: hypothetical protein ACFFA4_06050 [Promethearchaeota archaeon]